MLSLSLSPLLSFSQINTHTKQQKSITKIYILIKCTILQEDIAILNIYGLKTRVAIFIKLLQLKSHTDPHTTIVGDFHYTLVVRAAGLLSSHQAPAWLALNQK